MKKNISIIVSVITIFALAVPALITSAAAKNLKELIDNVVINGILVPLVPVLVGAAVIVFIYGVLVLVFSEGGEKKEEAKQYMLWGIIGIFVMVSVWGLVAILQGTFQLENDAQRIEIERVNI